MILYLLKSASCLALLLFFYHLVLEKEKMHIFNRYYLLFGVLLSLVIPFAAITISSVTDTTVVLEKEAFTPIITEDFTPILIEENPIDYTKYVIGLYLLVSSILVFRFGKNLYKIIKKINVNEKIKQENATLVLVDDNILPHTFWKAIFINKKDFKNGKIEKELFTHELTHVTQKHTIDVLLIEALQIVFWINPLFIFLKKAIQLNHEFLADSTVINTHKNTFQYQYLLLNKAAWNNEYYLASNLNYSLTKKRLKMMTTQSSKTIIWLKKLAVIPLLAGFVFLFAERVEAQEKKEVIEVTKTPINKKYIDSPIKNDVILSPNQYNIVPFETKPIKDNPINTNVGTITDIRLKLKNVNNLKIEYLNNDDAKNVKEVTPKEMKIYKTLLAKSKKNNIYKQKDILKMQDIYKRMSKKQKNSVENVSELIPPPPPPKPDWVYTYNRLASKVKKTSVNKKANLIYLKEIYNHKMKDEERAKVVAPEKLQVPPPPPKKKPSSFIKNVNKKN